MKPTQSWKHKGIDIAEWKNERGVNYTIRKTYYKKATGEYIEAKSWFREELKELHRLLGEAVATFGEEEAMPELAFDAPAAPKAPVAAAKFNDDDIPF